MTVRIYARNCDVTDAVHAQAPAHVTIHSFDIEDTNLESFLRTPDKYETREVFGASLLDDDGPDSLPQGVPMTENVLGPPVHLSLKPHEEKRVGYEQIADPKSPAPGRPERD